MLVVTTWVDVYAMTNMAQKIVALTRDPATTVVVILAVGLVTRIVLLAVLVMQKTSADAACAQKAGQETHVKLGKGNVI